MPFMPHSLPQYLSLFTTAAYSSQARKFLMVKISLEDNDNEWQQLQHSPDTYFVIHKLINTEKSAFCIIYSERLPVSFLVKV